MNTTELQAFIQKVSPNIGGQVYPFPLPGLPWEVRHQERLTFRNERHLYHRKCDFTQKEILSMYRKDAPFPVYCPEIWFGDKWDAKDYGRDYDFNRPFFDQFKDLLHTVPHLSLISHSNENCDFCNIVGKCRNCYLCFGSINCEDCYYGNPFECRNTSDSLVLRNSELCIECMDSTQLYNCYSCQNCNHSQNLIMCFGVDNSEDCIACVGLNRKKFHILNRPHSPEDYKTKREQLLKEGRPALQRLQKEFEALKLSMPHRAYIGTSNENISGDYIWNSKNSHDAFNVSECEDVHQVGQLLKSKDIVDAEHGEYGELLYEFMAYFDNVTRSAFSYFCWDNVSELFYCAHCTYGVKNCFGSVALRRSEYCILNKQYTKEEYEALLPRIIEHMKSTGEWGRFFPVSVSPFAYNETIAHEYFPLSAEEVRARGWQWIEDDTRELYRGPTVTVPDSIQNTPGDICSAILHCEQTGRPYKIIPQELKLYKTLGVPAPRVCPDQRHLNRLKKRNPRKLYTRNCAQCAAPIQTTYAPERLEKVVCESCYQNLTY